MKYIRTKDGRIIDTSKFEIKREIYENGELKLYEFWTTRFTDRQVVQLFTSEIIKQADTIEELCDVFVDTTGLDGIADSWRFDGYDKNKKVLWYITTGEDTRYIPLSEWEDKTVIKGAIWTEKGLIYVAKMNDKGELELL